MTNAQRQTKNTKHMDIKHFALQDWVQDDLLKIQCIDTSDNFADALMKATGTTLFHHHMETNYFYHSLATDPDQCSMLIKRPTGGS